MRIAGIDEAGRGPVIGPMVMGIAVFDEKDFEKLKLLGLKDSKLLTPLKREFLFKKIKAITENETIMVQPKEIDDAVLSEKSNLNILEANKIAELINNSNPDIVYVDCPSNNIKAYTTQLYGLINTKTKIIAEHKADAKYEIVSAASILAKVTRDRYIEGIKRNINVDFGSGYRSDPKTQKFIKNNWNKHNFFRKSWSTYQKIEKASRQKGLRDF